jgi:catechol 2,3-dioxygenase-like lactoylglutathione lyase family enzyme
MEVRTEGWTAVPRPGQWRLTDLQRLFLALAVVTAVFLSAMALGKRDIALLLVALLLLVVAGVAVFLLGLWYSSKRQVPGGMAYVISSSAPPAGSIVGRCDMRLLIDLADGGTKMIKLRDPAVSVTKWPRPGMVLPFEVDERNPRVMRVRWDRVNPNQPRGADDPFADTAPFHTDYAEDAAPSTDDQYAGPTPPVQTVPGHTVPAHTVPRQTPIILDDRSDFKPAFLDPAMDLVEPVVDFSSAPVDEPLQTPLVEDPFVEDPFVDDPLAEGPFVDDEPTEDTGPVPLPAEVADAEPEPTGETRAIDAGFEVPALVPRQPRDREPERLNPSMNGGSPPPGMGIMEVADFNRSLGFYRDLLGFEVVDHTSDQVVLAYSGKRLVLRPKVDASPVNLRVIHLHIEVPDVQAAYQELKAKGVEFAHQPRVLSRGATTELWAARFRDPDKHGIALTQWRDRQDAPRT